MSETIKSIGPVALSAAAATIYTVPAATTAVLVSGHVTNNDTGRVLFTLSIGADAAGTRLFPAVPIDPASMGDFLDFDSAVEMATGAVIQAYGSVASKLVFSGTVVETA